MPASDFLLWWCVSAGSYTVYSLLMELATGRTVGKTVLRVELLNEAGTRPGPAQIFVRNLMRLIEIMPPFWILGFFLVLSRNRQRVGRHLRADGCRSAHRTAVGRNAHGRRLVCRLRYTLA